jgi:hypothetical protein
MQISEKLLTTAIATAVAAALSFATFVLADGGGRADPPQPAAADGLGPGTPQHAAERMDRITGNPGGLPPLPPSTPRAVRIPRIGVDAPLTGHGLAGDGSLQVPPEEKPNLAAWFHGGVTPGTGGTALINGHVDNTDGPAVFYHLGALRPGDIVEIDRADGRTAVFTVNAIEVFDRDSFPDDLVYGHGDRPELRLLTCGGGFSTAAGGYLGNVVVFAHLTGYR